MKWKGSAQILLDHILPLCRILLNKILQNQMNMLNLISSTQQCSNERNACLILVSTIKIIAFFLFRKRHRWSFFLHTHGRKAKTRRKKSGQGFLNKKKSTCKIWVSFKQTKKITKIVTNITCFTTIFFN